MRTQSAVVAKGERIKAATKDVIVAWLVAATSYIAGKPDLVKRSFKACGISHALGGYENNLVRVDPESATGDSDDEEEQAGYDDDDVPIAELIAREIEAGH